ncbi:hypothetical protein [Gilvimarinus sp. 1_MG-2023]|uniref:hypothetical protein n=1 Tax=Gilvimarinus sp. 1_MG-2023 TaxID=3062638 RepID=UPI0026E429AF|nr:hypothetical protein [Gilvimarinus sp. 1_MG-2023]MDO6746786.1 hypothetical protein [Gilvimarinus sp. 1_MG-2023]
MKKTFSSLITLAVLLAGGCALVSPKTAEERVTERALERYDALMAGNYVKALRYTSAGYQARTTPSLYSMKFGGSRGWDSVKVASAECEETRCDVTVHVRHRLQNTKNGYGRLTNKERWILSDGEWWLYH